MRRMLIVVAAAVLAAACEPGSSPMTQVVTDVPMSGTSKGGDPFGEPSSIWAGSWFQPDTTLGRSELLPRLFVAHDEVLVVFEQNRGTTVAGERYDPVTGTATRIASSGLEWRANAAMVWTGDELLVVGGNNGPGIKRIRAAYNPAEDSWRPLPDPPRRLDA
ncbi:MAG: hypothetical protein H0T94_01940 [Acidimicrobiia bacterium]|nr:hypothetical protein [Acidimicrobiia bacterium]